MVQYIISRSTLAEWDSTLRRKDCREATDLKFGYRLRYPHFAPLQAACRRPIRGNSFESPIEGVSQLVFTSRLCQTLVISIRLPLVFVNSAPTVEFLTLSLCTSSTTPPPFYSLLGKNKRVNLGQKG